MNAQLFHPKLWTTNAWISTLHICRTLRLVYQVQRSPFKIRPSRTAKSHGLCNLVLLGTPFLLSFFLDWNEPPAGNASVSCCDALCLNVCQVPSVLNLDCSRSGSMDYLDIPHFLRSLWTWVYQCIPPMSLNRVLNYHTSWESVTMKLGFQS